MNRGHLAVTFQAIHINMDFFCKWCLGHFILSVISGYQPIKYLFYNLQNSPKELVKTKNKKKPRFASNSVFTLYRILLRNNKTPLSLFHQGFTLDCNSNESIYVMTSENALGQISNKQSMWLLYIGI